MVMKNYYIYRKLILATIHKCQGLSAIVDLSSKVFADGMAYVALSRIKSLAGLHLISFDNNSIKVDTKCLKGSISSSKEFLFDRSTTNSQK